MSLVVVALLAAVALGRLTGGSLERLGTLPLRSWPLVPAALVVQLLGAVVGGPLYPVGLVGSAALVVVFLARNRGVRGTGLVALGLAANALVVGANGAMPVSPDAAGRAGADVQDILTGADPRHRMTDDTTRLRWLADVIPVPMPLRPEVVSPGDVLVAAGVAQLVVVGMRRPLPGQPAARQRGAPPPTPGAAATTTPSRRPARHPAGRSRPLPTLPPSRPTSPRRPGPGSGDRS